MNFCAPVRGEIREGRGAAVEAEVRPELFATVQHAVHGPAVFNKRSRTRLSGEW